MNYNQDYSEIQEEIKKITYNLREKAKQRSKSFKKINTKRPVASWIKEDRMISEVGYEFVIILRTCACAWARSPSGGCTMCGYFNDRGPEDIKQEDIVQQFYSALEKNSDKLREIHEIGKHCAIKIFTSGSFLDDHEIQSENRIKIFNEIAKYEMIKEIIVETRPEFVTSQKLNELINLVPGKQLELGIGLESSNKFVREILINKGFSIESVKKAIQIAHDLNVRVKAYILLKPPFLSEKISIRDATQTIKDAIEMGFNSISLNPVNIQSHTMTEYLYYGKKYRSPWIYSVFKVFQNTLSEEVLSKVLILCDPSASGKERGVHNCNSKECNYRWLDLLKKFIFSQNLEVIKEENLPYTKCRCWGEYNAYIDFEKS